MKQIYLLKYAIVLAFLFSVLQSQSKVQRSKRKRTHLIKTSWQTINFLKLFRERRNTRRSLKNVEKRKEVVLGLLIPYNVTGKAGLSGYIGGEYYASAFMLAIEDINKRDDILPNIELKYVWNDTKCLSDLAIRSQIWMHCSYQGKERRGVDAFIGTGCKCGTVVKNAGALNLPIISHVSPMSIYRSIV